MKNMSKTAKFFVICAVVFTLGLVLTIGGCAAGGIDGIQEAMNGRIPDNGPAETEMIESDYALIEEYKVCSMDLSPSMLSIIFTILSNKG